jgi:hypothetical protein
MELMLHLLRVENEENGVVCIKIVIDQNRYAFLTWLAAQADSSAPNPQMTSYFRLLATYSGCRTFKSDTEKHVGEFLDLVKEMYRNLKEVVRSEFGVEGEVRLFPLLLQHYTI